MSSHHDGNQQFLVRLFQEAHEPGEFSPLAPPTDIEVDFQKLDPSLLQRLAATVELELQSGSYPLPLFEEDVLPLEIPDDCRCTVHVWAGKPEDDSKAEPMITGIEAHFSRPPRLGNILPVLARLNTHFKDKDLEALTKRLAALEAVDTAVSGLRFFARNLRKRLEKEVVARLPGQQWEKSFDELRTGLTSTLQKAATVELSRISAHPVMRRGEWILQLRFTGTVDYFGQVQIPFTRVHVPHVILPSPHALLSRLISPAPLATARLRTERLPTRSLTRALSGIVRRFNGTANGTGELPDTVLDTLLAGGGEGRIQIASPGEVTLETAFAGTLESDKLELAVQSLAVELPSGQIHASSKVTIAKGQHFPTAGEHSVASVLATTLMDRQWTRDLLSLKVQTSILENSTLDGLEVRVLYRHPKLLGSTDLLCNLDYLAMEGEWGVQFGAPADDLANQRMSLKFESDVSLDPTTQFDTGRTLITTENYKANLCGMVESSGNGMYTVAISGEAGGGVNTHTATPDFPELEIEKGALGAQLVTSMILDGQLSAFRHGGMPLEFDFAGSNFRIHLDSGKATLDKLRLDLPDNSRYTLGITEGKLAVSGLGRASIDVQWDFLNQSPVLRKGRRKASLLVPDLRNGQFTVHISPTGGLTVSGDEEGLYDARYFNALLNPQDELPKILEILSSEDAMDRVFAATEIVSKDVHGWLVRIQDFTDKMRRIFEQENITQPKDTIPAEMMARVGSRILVDSTRLEKRIHPLVKRVTDGKGLDVPAIKRLIADVYPDHKYDFEVDRLTRWLAQVLGPTEPPPPHTVIDGVPLAEDPKYLEMFEGLPAAATLYRTVDSANGLSPRFSATVARIAPYLTLEQVNYVLARQRDDWRPKDLERIAHIRELKRRVRMISRGYGGVSYAPQAIAIAFFLAETINMSRKQRPEPVLGNARVGGLLSDCLLGPEDLAVLLHAGLASAWVGRAVELNQRMLLELVLEQSSEFLRAVLLEMGATDSRVLAGVLLALLDQPQDCLVEPLDLVEQFSQRLDIDIPRVSDYMAGGRRAKHSYYHALTLTADEVMSGAEPYRALKYYLQEARHPADLTRRRTSKARRLESNALEAILQADKVSARCTFSGPEPRKRKWAANAYREAFNACHQLSSAEPRAFQKDWFKQFWGRNYEALMVLSVTRNIQQNIDSTRRWLRVRTGKSVPRDEQKLVGRVIEALYFYEEDRNRLKSDPLVRLLIDPPDGSYDFSIITAMGVITSGAQGFELESAFQRMEQKRGVALIRADTETARPLDYNALRIIEAIRKSKTPYGLVGYSQGCANVLTAESKLKSGTPDQQRLLDGLRTRNLLFTASNGSPHGTCGDLKFMRAMVDMDHFLAHYQTVFSGRAIQAALRTIRLVLDSQAVVLGMLGTRSLSRWGVLALHGGGQFKSDVSTATMRGIVEPETLPEALEMLCNVLSKQIGHTNHDTQVLVEEALGHSVFIRNDHTPVLAACDMGGLVQRTHHWSPLLKDTESLTTQRDIDQAIYDFPKDRHIFPWIEVNARFGKIDKR